MKKKKVMKSVKVDGISFNKAYWAKKSEAEFIKAQEHSAPIDLDEKGKAEWLRNAYKLIKEGPAPEKVAVKEASK